MTRHHSRNQKLVKEAHAKANEREDKLAVLGQILWPEYLNT